MTSPYRDNALCEFNERNSLLHEVEELTCYFYTHDDSDTYTASKVFVHNFKLNIIYQGTANEKLSVSGCSARNRLYEYLTNSHKITGGYLLDDCFIAANNLKNIKIVSKKFKKLLVFEEK